MYYEVFLVVSYITSYGALILYYIIQCLLYTVNYFCHQLKQKYGR